MAGVIPSDMTNSSKLADVRVGHVTSSTRFNWSKQEVSIFEAFIRENHITSNSQKKSADLGALLSALQLDRFLSLNNTKGEPLRPIIETKVERKLGSVITSLNQGQYPDQVAPQNQDRTRLQAARTRAVAAGMVPPNRLPRPDPIYIPDNWKTKAARKSTSSSRPQPAAISTVEKARAEVVRLEKALTLARANLTLLQHQEQEELDKQLSEHQHGEDEQEQHDTRKEPRASSDAVVSLTTSAASSSSHMPNSSPARPRSSQRTRPAATKPAVASPASDFEFENGTSSDDDDRGPARRITTDPTSREALLPLGYSERRGSPSHPPSRTPPPSQLLPSPVLHKNTNTRHVNGSKAPRPTSSGLEPLQSSDSTDTGISQQRQNKTLRVRRLDTNDLVTLTPPRRLQDVGSGDESDRELDAYLKRASAYLNKYGKTGGRGGKK